VPFLAAATYVPPRVALWPRSNVVRDHRVGDFYRDACPMRRCPLCGIPTALELHHIFGGAVRSDELTNFIWLCGACHELVQSRPAYYPVVLRAKWVNERHLVSWPRMLYLRGRFFDFDII
jgi:5-methylcytosine-specific restriction endonuclease McrA